MTDRNPSTPEDRGGVDPQSRRTFLAMTSSSVALSLAATPASGTQRSSFRNSATIGVSPTLYTAGRDTTEAIGNDRSNGTVSIQRMDMTTGVERFIAGEFDAFVGSRPLLPAERSLVNEHGISVDQHEIQIDIGALRPPESTWVDCLSPADLVDSWTREGPIETWAEVAPRNPSEMESRELTVEEQTHTAGSREGSEDSTSPQATGTIRHPSVFIRGIRAYQYASGFGGVGYYEPGDDWLVRSSENTGQDVDSLEPIVQLSYLLIDRDSSHLASVKQFHVTYVRQAMDDITAIPVLVDPIWKTKPS